MAIKPPQIPGPATRPRIPVSDEARKEARSGMGGEQTKVAEAPSAADALPVPATEPVAPIEVAPTPTNEPPAVLVPEPVASTAPVTASAGPTAPAPVDEHLAATANEPTPGPAVPALDAPPVSAPAAPVAVVDEAVAMMPTAPRAAPTNRRGRKPRPADAPSLDSEHSIRIAESVWNEIRLNLALLPKGADNPTNIKKYIELAHKAYEAQLRKQGKLPS